MRWWSAGVIAGRLGGCASVSVFGRGQGGEGGREHRCKATTAAVADGQTARPLSPPHTHTKHTVQQVWASIQPYVRTGYLITFAAWCFYLQQIKQTKKHLNIVDPAMFGTWHEKVDPRALSDSLLPDTLDRGVGGGLRGRFTVHEVCAEELQMTCVSHVHHERVTV